MISQELQSINVLDKLYNSYTSLVNNYKCRYQRYDLRHNYPFNDCFCSKQYGLIDEKLFKTCHDDDIPIFENIQSVISDYLRNPNAYTNGEHTYLNELCSILEHREFVIHQFGSFELKKIITNYVYDYDSDDSLV